MAVILCDNSVSDGGNPLCGAVAPNKCLPWSATNPLTPGNYDILLFRRMFPTIRSGGAGINASWIVPGAISVGPGHGRAEMLM